MCRYVKPAAELVAAPVRWLWDGWLPASKLVLLDGDPGTGKSTLACELAARLSRGDWGGEPAPVLLVNAEDGEADTTAPRLAAAGADLARVHVWDWSEPLELPRDLDKLRAAIRETGAKLVVLDPLSALVGRGATLNSEQSVRRLLVALGRLAEQEGCTVLLLRHLRKQSADNPMHRGLGSIGIVAAVRVAWLLGYHPGGEERRVLTMTKCNVGPVAAAKVFRVSDGRVSWGADEEWLSPADVVRSTATGVMRWLGQVLERGPKKSERIKSEAAVLGISDRTLWRAKRSMRIVAKSHFHKWYWCLPGQDPQERYSGLEPMDDVEPHKKAVLEPVEKLGPAEDDGSRLRVPEGASERQILRQAAKALRASVGGVAGRALTPRPPLPRRERGSKGGQGPGSGPDALPGPTPPSPLLGEGGRGGEGKPSPAPDPPGSRRFDPAPAGALDLVVRVAGDDADWPAKLTDRLFRFEELVKGRVGELAGFDWEPAWTGPLGDGRLRLVLAPRGVPPDRVAGLPAWAHEALGQCESARLAA